MASLTVEGSTWQGASRCACMGVCVYGCPHILSDLHFLSFHGNFPRIKSVLKKSSRGEGEGCKAEPTSNCVRLEILSGLSAMGRVCHIAGQGV